MTIKEKSWVWWLTFPFAHANFTTVWNTIYTPKGVYPSSSVIAHEKIHSEQQKVWGPVFVPLWILLYLFFLPILWNPLRWSAEYEAFTKGSGYSDKRTRDILRSYSYGWLL